MTPNLHAYIARQAAAWDDMTVVEIGAKSAPGQEHMHLADVIEQGATYIGIDIEDGRHVDYTVDITDVSRESDVADDIARADVVLCLETLEHTPRFWRVLDVFGWMKPGATLIVSVPAFDAAGKTFAHHRYPVDCYRFHEDAVPALMEGFDVVEVLRLTDTRMQETLVMRGTRKTPAPEPKAKKAQP